MSDADLLLIERAASRGLISAEALDRARRDCRGNAGEWLLSQNLLTREQLSRLLEDEIPLLPREAGKDSSWAVIVIVFVIAGTVLFGAFFYSYARPAAPPSPGTGIPLVPYPEVEGARAMAAGHLPLAIAYYSQAIARSPGRANFYAIRSNLYQRTGNVAMALADAETAVSLESTDAGHRLIRAAVWAELGRFKDVVDDLEKLPPSPERDPVLEAAKKAVEAEKK